MVAIFDNAVVGLFEIAFEIFPVIHEQIVTAASEMPSISIWSAGTINSESTLTNVHNGELIST